MLHVYNILQGDYIGDFFKVAAIGFFAIAFSLIDALKFTNVDLNEDSCGCF
jgi:hypothetical protein